MPPNRTKANASGLGKAIINRRAKEAVAPKESQLYALDDNNPLASVTHERDIDEFLANAALADTDFMTERSKARIISVPDATAGQNPFLLSAEEEKQVAKKQYDYRDGLTVPRRPPWTRKTTRQELERQERDSFIDWRRQLAQLAENSNLLLTPFERNIQLWRQLWRVLERSHLVVQIVDARNVLGFRSADLEKYVREVGDEGEGEDTTVPGRGQRKSLLLINKADLLTIEQRRMWADYFEREGIAYAFFSAADAAAAQEQAEKQRKREEGVLEEEESEDEEEDEEDVQAEQDVEVEEVEDESEGVEGASEPDSEEDLSKAVEETVLDDEDEEGWSTEGEQDATDEITTEAEAKLAKGEHVPLKQIAQDFADPERESDRTRVLTVTELEDLFISSAPDLKHFATERQPEPKTLMVGLVGYPNVGKSSTINALLGAKKVSVSSTPGKTKHFQTLVLSDKITLCDCPGLVFPQFASTQADMVLDGVLPIDQMREYSAPADLVSQRIPREILEGTYGIRIDVKSVEEGGTGKVTWEDLLSTYAIARGMTRSSFGMPDTSRAARYVLKDYVNAKLLFAHPPPGVDVDEFMSTSRERTLADLEQQFENGRKRAPVSHVSKNADTYVAPAPDAEPKEKQLTTASVRRNAASAPMRSGKEKAEALDGVFFAEAGPAPRPVLTGRNQGGDKQEGGLGYARNTAFPHQRQLGADGMPIVDSGVKMTGNRGGKKHFKVREGKKRSGRGYD